MNTMKAITTTDNVRGFVSSTGDFVKLTPVESAYTILGMSEERSDELSRAMLNAIDTIDPKNQRFVTSSSFEPAEFEDDDWDRQMKSDAESGKLDALVERALAHRHAGRMKEI